MFQRYTTSFTLLSSRTTGTPHHRTNLHRVSHSRDHAFLITSRFYPWPYARRGHEARQRKARAAEHRPTGAAARKNGACRRARIKCNITSVSECSGSSAVNIILRFNVIGAAAGGRFSGSPFRHECYVGSPPGVRAFPVLPTHHSRCQSRSDIRSDHRCPEYRHIPSHS
jgi:hypothetical protein